MSSSEIKTTHSKVVYQNRWLTLREDGIERDSGATGIYTVVDKPDFVVVIPLDGETVYLVEQFRYPVGERQMEFPQGAWEDNPDADPLELAKGELQEETGFLASEWHYVGFQYLAYGFCKQGYHIYVAKGLTMTQTSLEPEEEGLVTKSMPLADFENLILSGDIKDATTCNAFGLARLKKLI
ncbi:NUDIX hydrolase [Alteromonas aestuariivivens]|uniref:GDP-mannose pyrophosphatase n=1 Tax=Alteromonas aestuariivivens TaxID=1938339 RepID=A0A3D8M4A4_9ALTE|nr:NUDIX hydrolase [Alteromonas aestuariivivens]RDV24577.1 NUDIX hydrolase [Alteromonas aestuariivivens]